MPLFEISIPGRMYSYWPDNKEIHFNECKFEKGEIFGIYPDVNKQEVYESINKLKDLRGEIHHKAARNPDNLDERLEQIENIYTDIQRHKLGLECNNLSKKYFI